MRTMLRHLGLLTLRLSEKAYSSIPFPIIFCLVYFIFQGFSFAQLKSGGDIDTTEMLLYTQYWDWGYGGSQPPLYSWLALGVIDCFGLSLLTLSLLKFALLGIAYVTVYAIARKLGLSRLAATCSMFGIFTIPVIGWEAQRSLSHSSALLAFSALAVLTFIQAGQTGSMRSYCIFGLALACALLSKYNAILLFAALVIAALWIKPWRRTVLNPKFAAAIMTTIVFIAPHLLWVYRHPSDTLARSSKFNFHATGNALTDLFWGIKSFLSANLLMTSLLAIIVLTTAARQKISSREIRLPRRDDPASLIIVLILVSEVIMAAGIIFSGATTLPNRWLQPVLMFVPLATAILFSSGTNPSLLRSPETRKKCKTVHISQAALGLVCAFIVIFALPLTTVFKKSGIPKANQLNYAALHAEIKDKLGENPSSLLLTDYSIFANLRFYQPELKIIHPFVPYPERLSRPPRVILWEGHVAMPAKTRTMAQKALIDTDGLITLKARLGRTDNPDIFLAVSYAFDPDYRQHLKIDGN